MKIEIAGVTRDETATLELAKQSFGLVEGGLVPFSVLGDDEGNTVTLSRHPGGWMLERRLDDGYAVAEIPSDQSARLGAWWLKAAEGAADWTRGLPWKEAPAPEIADEDRPASVLQTDKDDRFEQPDADLIRRTLARLASGEVDRVQLKTTYNRNVEAIHTPDGRFELAACDTAGLSAEHITSTATNLEAASAPFLALADGDENWLKAGGLSWKQLGKNTSVEESKAGCLSMVVLGLLTGAAIGAGTLWLA